MHHGWTLHFTDDAGDVDDDRYALLIMYVDGRAELREDVLSSPSQTAGNNAAVTRTAKYNKEEVWSFRLWVSEVEPRLQFRHPMVPIVWPPTERDAR